MDYELYPNFQQFVPTVEESRGCFSNCNFCPSPKTHGKIRVKDPKHVAEEVRTLQQLYGEENFHFFMGGNTFGANHNSTEELAERLQDLDSSWRCESRADTFPIQHLDKLIKAGMKVLDIGLESGSPEMLRAMNKTSNPARYLRKSLELARKLGKTDCLLRLNIMLYYGETQETINETLTYLGEIAKRTNLSVGAGPVVLEPGSLNYKTIRADPEQFRGTFWEGLHCYPLDLSEELSFKDAQNICLGISQQFQSSQDYFEVKRHSQLHYNLTYKEFMRQARQVPRHARPWS